jgi:methionyl-tRNA synthetase
MKYYLTTPIYYVNSAPHIGHAYCTMAADTIKRFKRMQGYDARITTGSDEHGQNVERAAKGVGVAPEVYATTMATEWRQTWDKLGLEYDYFIRTSDPKHHVWVQEMFQRCLKNGYIYEGAYTGQYCFHCELYVNEAKPGDPCPDCGRPTETVTEKNYFFKLSAFQQRLLDWYEANPEWIRPETRRNEVLAFVKGGLNDLSITRTTIKWGIPVPVEGHHVFYVWFDALISYMTAVLDKNLWPADLHLIGKEIVRFHAVYWPAFLMAADLELPKAIYAHGWLLFENDKMSKSRGNVVRALPIQDVMGADALRYYLFREVVFGQDGSFSYDALVTRYNADLANGLGNLASRTLTMIQQYRGGKIPAGAADAEIGAGARQAIATFTDALERLEFSRALEAVWGLQSQVDKYIVTQAPWKLVKKPDGAATLDGVLYTAAEALRVVTALASTVLPESAARIWSQLGMTEPLDQLRIGALDWGQLAPGQQIGEIAGVFPRLDVKLTVEKLRDLEEKEAARQKALMGKGPAPAAAASAAAVDEGRISIEDFAKVELRVAQVLSAEPVKGADKLLHLKVDAGEAEPRTLVAGIAEAYKPEDLIGRKIIIVANLQPRKLRGITSNGMLLAATAEGGKPVLAGFHEEIPPGARLK